MKLTLDTTLREILNAQTLEPPENFARSQEVLAVLQIVDFWRWHCMDEDLEVQASQEIQTWLSAHPDKRNELIDEWFGYYDESEQRANAYTWALEDAYEELCIEMEESHA